MAVSSLTDLKKIVNERGYGLLECSSKEVAEILMKRLLELYPPPHYGVCLIRVKEINVYSIYY